MAQLPQTVAECHAVIALLMERVKVLEERVNLDSNNSSRPPSSNGPGQMNRAQRRGSERKRGAHRADTQRQSASGPHFILGLTQPVAVYRSCQTLGVISSSGESDGRLKADRGTRRANSCRDAHIGVSCRAAASL